MPIIKITKLIFFLTLVLIGSGLVVHFFSSRQETVSLEKESKLHVVTTVAPLTNIVYNIAGDRIALQGIIPEGTDSHTFEPAPSDVQILGAADLIIINGLHLETSTEKLAQSNKKNRAVIFRLGENTINENDWLYDFSFPKEKGDPNPHLWMNPQYAKRYAELVRNQLVQRDPVNTAYYQDHAKKYITKIEQLDKSVEDSIQTIPPQNRKLLTYHDSWAYFARRYGMEVVAAIQPADFKEPSPQEVARLIDQLKKEHIPAIFASEVFISKVLDQIASEANVYWVATLRDDDLPGEKNAPDHTYIGMMLEDMKNMIIPLGGNIDALKKIDATNIAP